MNCCAHFRYPSTKKLLQTFVPEVLLHGNPSSVDWVLEDPNHMIVAFENASCGIYDVETGQQVVQLDTALSQVRNIFNPDSIHTSRKLSYFVDDLFMKTYIFLGWHNCRRHFTRCNSPNTSLLHYWS